MIQGKINEPVTISSVTATDWKQITGPQVNMRIALDKKSMSFTPSENGLYTFQTGSQKFEVSVGETTQPPTPEPTPTPQPQPTGDIIYDSLINSQLHNKQKRTIEKEGGISPGGLGVECRASGNPRIQVNDDGTFSLLCDAGHGRFYLYALNYNATLRIECAFWNSVSGQDLSLKIRSRHNEGGAESNRFGGYGLSLDRSGWGSKVEQFHNEHSESVSGSLPSKPETQKYFTVDFTAKDEGDKVRIIGKYNGTQIMSRLVKKYNDAALFAQQSYLWVRSNIDSGTGEIRIKRIMVLRA